MLPPANEGPEGRPMQVYVLTAPTPKGLLPAEITMTIIYAEILRVTVTPRLGRVPERGGVRGRSTRAYRCGRLLRLIVPRCNRCPAPTESLTTRAGVIFQVVTKRSQRYPREWAYCELPLLME